jgi:predicted O-methyltransferase YrrM
MNDSQLAALNKRLDRIEERILRSSDTTHRVSDRLQRRLYAQVEALINLYRDLDGLPSLPALRNWALSPDTARELHALISTYRPSHVVELGGGASTVLLGHMKMAGQIERITSVEHDPVYFELTLRSLELQGLTDAVDLVLAPLDEVGVGDGQATWYSLVTDDIDAIDLLIVDGPPASTGELARFPAVPALIGRMNPGCMIVVDDFDRADETLMVEQWRADYPFELLRVNRAVEKSLAVLECVPLVSTEWQEGQTDA